MQRNGQKRDKNWKEANDRKFLQNLTCFRHGLTPKVCLWRF
jgi:hypothetical protein